MSSSWILFLALGLFLAMLLLKFSFPRHVNYFLSGEKRSPESSMLQFSYGDILDYLPTGLFVLNTEHQICYANSMFSRKIDRETDEILGKSLAELFDVCEEVTQTLSRFSEDAPDDQKSARLTYSDVNGEKQTLRLSISTFETKNKRFYLCLVPSYKNLVDTREQIRQSERIRALGEMISGLAHEINNPLTGVIGFANLLQEDERSKPIQNELNIIQENARRCKDIIDNLLDFVRPGNAKDEEIDINQLLETSIKLIKRNLDISNIEIEEHLDPELPPVRANRTQIEEIFVNLLNNAEQELKQADPVSKLIRVSSRPMKDGKVAIRIEDSGRGVPKENWDEIFEPFYTTKSDGEGTGLGLSISRGILQDMGREIKIVESSILRGACFEIILPSSENDSNKLETQGSPEMSRDHFVSEVETILLVDDEQSIRQLFEKIFEKQDIKGTIVSNPLEAIDWLERRSEDPDIIILDLVYPGRLKGRDMVRWLEDNASHLLERVIFITGNPHDSQIDYLESHTDAPLLRKPLDMDEVMDEAARLLEKIKQ